MAASLIQPNAIDLALGTLSKLPPFSPTLNRLLGTLSHEDVSLAKISDLIEKDPVLAGNVLGLVNSALYGRRGRVNSVRHAVSLLGVSKLRNAALGMSVTRLWGKVRTAPGWSMVNFNQHAIASAILADLLCQEASVVYPEGAFVAGLLHDLGKLLVAVGLPDSYVEIGRLSGLSGQTAEQIEMDVLGFRIADLSAEALRTWNLPEQIQVAVRYHECPEADPTLVGQDEFPLSRVIGAAHRYTDQSDENVFEFLGIDLELPRLLIEFHKEYESIRELL